VSGIFRCSCIDLGSSEMGFTLSGLVKIQFHRPSVRFFLLYHYIFNSSRAIVGITYLVCQSFREDRGHFGE
jgi:hypothetical protein